MGIDAEIWFCFGTLVLIGITLLTVAIAQARFIERTAHYAAFPMTVIDVNLVPNNLTGQAVVGALTDRTAMVLVRYAFASEGGQFQARRVFPLDVEWMRPRSPPLLLFEDLKAGRLRTCHVDARRPEEALLFRGWSPYLRSHVLGVGAAGALLLALGCALLAFFAAGARYAA